MAVGLRQLLPTPRHQHFSASSEQETQEDQPLYTRKPQDLNKHIPPYGQRVGWVPRVLQDFGDGGAFPEVHVAQYPLNMGKKGAAQQGQIVALTSDSSGKLGYDAIVKQGHDKNVVVWSKHSDMVEKNFKDEDLQRPDEQDEQETARRTLELLQAKMDKQTVNDPLNQVGQNVKYIRYTPATQSESLNSGASHRIIRMTEMPKDPLEPPKFKFTKSVAAPGSPPVPVMHSPPKPLSKEERDAFKIPPSISNWKNSKGYIIPLDKRAAAEGRELQEHKINDAFANLSESLYIAERTAREELQKRLNLKKELELQQQKEKDEELMRIAQEARMQRAQVGQAPANETREERLARVEREKIREERRLEREREHRLAQRGRESKKSKVSRDFERDISEKIALGEAVPRTQESLFDSRLFNKTGGLDSGFGDDEGYNVYDKRLFGGERERALYKAPQREELEQYGNEQSLDEIANTKRFKPHKDFQGVDRSVENTRTGPVQYEKDNGDDTGYGLSELIGSTSRGKQEAQPVVKKEAETHQRGQMDRSNPREDRDDRRRDDRDDRRRDNRDDRRREDWRDDRRDDRRRDDRRDDRDDRRREDWRRRDDDRQRDDDRRRDDRDDRRKRDRDDGDDERNTRRRYH